MPFFFFLFSVSYTICMARSSNIVLHRNVEIGLFVLFLILEERFPAFHHWVWWKLSYMAFIMLKYISSLPTIMRVFTIIGRWILWNMFSASIEMVIWLLSLLLLIRCISGNLLQYSCWENPTDRARLGCYSAFVTPQ